MKAKLIIGDKEIEIEISEEEYKKLQPSEEKKTGYERVPESDIYFCANSRGYAETACEDYYDVDNEYDGVNLSDINTAKFYIYYDYRGYKLESASTFSSEVFGTIHFDSKEAIQAAIDEFREELIWYFTEYKDSL